VDKLALPQACELFLPDSTGWVNAGAATLSVDLKTAGLKRFNAEINGSVPSLTLARGTREAVIESKDFKVHVTGDEKMLRVAVASLPLVSPRLDATGDVIFDRPSSSFTVKLTGRDLDAGMIRKSALVLADDVASVGNVFRYVQSGTIPEIHFESRGRSFAEAFDFQRAVVTGNLRGGKILVPESDLDLENVNGAVSISAGVLECTKCSATLEKARGRDGALRVGLANPRGPFHLDIRVDTDAKDLQSLLLRLCQACLSRKLPGFAMSGSVRQAGARRNPGCDFSQSIAVEAARPPPMRPCRIHFTQGRSSQLRRRQDRDENLAGAVGRSSFPDSAVRCSRRTEQVDIKSANYATRPADRALAPQS
jgi:hypothetical protein